MNHVAKKAGISVARLADKMTGHTASTTLPSGKASVVLLHPRNDMGCFFVTFIKYRFRIVKTNSFMPNRGLPSSRSCGLPVYHEIGLGVPNGFVHAEEMGLVKGWLREWPLRLAPRRHPRRRRNAVAANRASGGCQHGERLDLFFRSGGGNTQVVGRLEVEPELRPGSEIFYL